ncbi:MAG: serine/threonine protein kinase [Lachnospiraceae bacterium]|nr:serine/threonine protein kinase [Lachnospiraceae bacterium]
MKGTILECVYGDDTGPKGGGRIEAATLFGKYQICRELGRGRSGTVFLAKHLDLEEYRAIKRVPKSCADYEQFRKEALILKSIRHPGIPIVYDLMESADYSYMILEFLSGNSIYALVSDMGHLSKAMTVRYGIQICRLVCILHSARPTPILYLDLQPKNLLVCCDTVKLIDFDHSVHLHEAESMTKRYGTVGYAAPEQYTGEVLDERTDIYAIGAVLYYMLTGTYPDKNWNGTVDFPRGLVDRSMANVIRRCLRSDKAGRYQSAEQLCDALEEIRRKLEREERRIWGSGQISSLTIAVAGSGPGAGTTHIAMGLTAYLRKCGLSAMYEERNESGAVRQFASCISAGMDEAGICMIQGIPMLPFYGNAVKLEANPYPVVVRDYGSDWRTCCGEQADEADGYLLICGGKPWEWNNTREAVSGLGIHPGQAIIYNHFCRQLYGRLPGPARGTDCFLMPEHSNPLRSGKEAEKIYEAVMVSLTGKRTGGILRKLFGKIERRMRSLPGWIRKRTGAPLG